ncbi:MAG: DUF3375 domain-containing protein [Xanthomonadaceae bacterium]|nr:DUF3375 domain-containing protein [Xanthomonadaceae bacterium]
MSEKVSSNKHPTGASILDFHDLKTLRKTHAGWRLLAADHGPMVVAFLNRAFVEPNQRVLAESELTVVLDDVLHHLREIEGPESFPKNARAYLMDWSADERGWLRRFYVEGSDEPHYDLTPPTEKAIRWLQGLEQTQFVGAESRLLTVFELLRQIVTGAESDPEVRIAELEQNKAELDREIDKIRNGHLGMLDDTRLRERFMQMAETARALLGDFRQVEDNFRQLDRQVRERITRFEGSKGEVLADIFGEQDAISDSDQGRSFRAFWDFLMSPLRQEEFSAMLDKVLSLNPIIELRPDRSLRRIHDDWLGAGEQTQRTIARLSEQLRRFLDDRAWLENRRIMDLIQNIEQNALEMREQPPIRLDIGLDETAPRVELPLERPLYSPPLKPRIDQHTLDEGRAEVDSDALFNQIFVDRDQLRANIRRALQSNTQISLENLIAERPLELGLAELVSYLAIAAEDPHAMIDETVRSIVFWTGADGTERRAQVPRVIFAR